MRTTLRSAEFALAVGFLTYFASLPGPYKLELGFLILAIALSFFAYLALVAVRFFAIKIQEGRYTVIANEVHHHVLLIDDKLLTVTYFNLLNRGKEPARTLIADYEGGAFDDQVLPVYRQLSRSQLSMQALGAIGLDEGGVKFAETMDYTRQGALFYSEWPVGIHEPLQPGELVEFTRYYEHDLAERLLPPESTTEFSYRPRTPTRRFRVTVYSRGNRRLTDHEIFIGNEQGKRRRKPTVWSANSFSIEVEEHNMSPTDRLVIRFHGRI